MEKLEPSCLAGRDVKWFSCFRKQTGGSSIKHRVSHDPVALLLGTHLR